MFSPMLESASLGARRNHETKRQKQVIALLLPRHTSSKFSSKKKRQKNSVVPAFPAKLQLVHNEEPVAVDCMFVEVKSENDRLDARQEDWLNIIDVFADARVCKFGSKKKS